VFGNEEEEGYLESGNGDGALAGMRAGGRASGLPCTLMYGDCAKYAMTAVSRSDTPAWTSTTRAPEVTCGTMMGWQDDGRMMGGMFHVFGWFAI
jgi:hypothetical protein